MKSTCLLQLNNSNQFQKLGYIFDINNDNLLPDQLETLRSWPKDGDIHNAIQFGYKDAVLLAKALKLLPKTGPLGLGFRFRTSFS